MWNIDGWYTLQLVYLFCDRTGQVWLTAGRVGLPWRQWLVGAVISGPQHRYVSCCSMSTTYCRIILLDGLFPIVGTDTALFRNGLGTSELYPTNKGIVTVYLNCLRKVVNCTACWSSGLLYGFLSVHCVGTTRCRYAWLSALLTQRGE